ncbi:MAG: RagB/SusD family nutrient uptake outer membrane protein [Bacteroidetes bacterium]|nr:RagB/SusD family nutrient uptake outer membrane protein [Bacteroidota bacterium]
MTIAASAQFLDGCHGKIDLAPYNSLDANTAFATAERCQLALYGVYDAAQSGVYDPLNGAATSDRGYPFGAASIEQGDMRGEDMVNVAAFYQTTYQSLYTPLTPNNVNMWKELYALINKANLSITGFRNAAGTGILTGSVAAQYEAECRFLRAMAHHELLLHFARPYADGNGSALGVPYRDYPINSQADIEFAKTKPREPVSDCYAKILADLDYAETNLPASLGTGGISTYRATKAAAIALKMRVKLHKGDWAGVITEGNKLIPAAIDPTAWTTVVSPIGAWALTATPDGPFTNNLSSESIFSMKNDPVDNPGTNASLPRMYAFSSATGGRGLCSISPLIWNLPEWTCGDKRRTLLYTNGSDNAGNQNKFTTKYKDAVNQSDYTPYIRYAEVLLMQAEAEARNNANPTPRAIDLLNTVRNRSLANPATEAYTLATLSTQATLINAILKERRIEFLAEGKRWADIHRLAVDPVFGTAGVPAKMTNGYSNLGAFLCAGALPATGVAAIPYSDYRFLWPIPQQERNTNPIIEQNPGY